MSTATVISFASITWKVHIQNSVHYCVSFLHAPGRKNSIVHFMTAGKIVGETKYLGFYANETVWDQEYITRIKVRMYVLYIHTYDTCTGVYNVCVVRVKPINVYI